MAHFSYWAYMKNAHTQKTHILQYKRTYYSTHIPTCIMFPYIHVSTGMSTYMLNRIHTYKYIDTYTWMHEYTSHV